MTPISNLKSFRAWAALTIIPFLVFLVFYIIPVLNTIQIGFSEYDYSTNTSVGWQIQTIWNAVTDSFFIEVLWRTIKLSLLTTIICLLVGYPVSFFLINSRGWSQSICYVLLLMPLVTSTTVTSYGWLILLGQNGVVNSALLQVGLVDRPLRILQSETGIVIALVNVLVVFMVVSIASSLNTIDHNQVLAARSLGAGKVRAFVSVTLPQSMPGIKAGSLLVFVLAMSAYATPAIVGGARLKFVSFLIYQQSILVVDWSRAAAYATVLLTVTIFIIVMPYIYSSLVASKLQRR